MPKFKNSHITIKKRGKSLSVIPTEIFESFNENVLGLGKIDKVSNPINTLSVMFDLEGFTSFCKQIDPHLAVPDYLSRFLKWLFDEIKIELTNKRYREGVDHWADFPFFAKFLGDGVLFLWSTDSMHESEIRNVVVSMLEITEKYTKYFLPSISSDIISPPFKLRCGIARGIVYTIGSEDDFVGPCINMSARLQKQHSFTFCFSRRGINPSEFGSTYKNRFVIKKANIRGIGPDELICVLKSEFEKLSDKEKEIYSN